MDAPAFRVALPLDRVTGVALEPGARFEVHGQVASSLDGATLDAAHLFDFGAGGLRVVHAGYDHSFVLEATGEDGDVCAVVHAPTPCLVPRLSTLAHDHFRTAAEYASTLSGGVELLAIPKMEAPLPAVVPWALVLLAVGVMGASVAWALSRRIAQTALGRVRTAARRALRATRADATLEPVRRRILGLVAQARAVDVARRELARKLARVDRAALDRRADALARSPVAVANGALESLQAERAEAAQLEAEYASAVVELEHIESVLRRVVLRAGGHRGGKAAGTVPGLPMAEEMAAELELRDRAMAEVESA